MTVMRLAVWSGQTEILIRKLAESEDKSLFDRAHLAAAIHHRRLQ